MFKRGNTYWCKFRYNGKVIQKSLDTGNRNLARKIEAKIRTRVAEGKYFEKSIGEEKTVSNMMDKFMIEHAPTVSESMQISYKCSLNSLLPFFGDLMLSSIAPKIVSDYKIKRRIEGVKPATINRELAMLSKSINMAANEWQWLKQPPRIKKEKINNARDRWLNENEEKRFQKACLDLEYNWLCDLVDFDINTGLRMGELISLEWPEFNFNRRTIFIKETKNKESRTIPLNRPAYDNLYRKSKIRRINTKLVFLNNACKKWDKCNLGKIFRKVLNHAKIEDFRFHDLRHTFGSRLAQAGVDINTIARLMGHKDLKMTQRYIHHTVDSLRAGVNKLENPGYNLATMQQKKAN